MNLSVKFRGTRGSFPATFGSRELRGKIVRALRIAGERGLTFSTDAEAERFVREELPFRVAGTYGSATSCIEISAPGIAAPLLLDGGSGLQSAGRGRRDFREQHMLLSHLHWDHIHGIPFYAPLYEKDFHLVIHSCHAAAEIALRAQMSPPFFPISHNDLPAKISFVTHAPGNVFDAGGFAVNAVRQVHPGDSFGYRVEAGGKCVCYSTDAAPGGELEARAAVLANADLLIYDAMLSDEEARAGKASWGHSSCAGGINFGMRSGARRLAFTHHDSTKTDEELDAIFENVRSEANRRREKENWPAGVLREIFAACDGLETLV